VRVASTSSEVHYCNRDCQLLHWRDPSDLHKAQCCGRCLIIRYCDATCQPVHWRSPTDPHNKARGSGCDHQDDGMTKLQAAVSDDSECAHGRPKRALKMKPQASWGPAGPEPPAPAQHTTDLSPFAIHQHHLRERKSWLSVCLHTLHSFQKRLK
jgi:hypothetical protein